MEEAEIVSFRSIADFGPVALSFRELLGSKLNADIALDFPGTVKRYAGLTAQAELEKTAGLCSDGQREQFIVFYNQLAVGLAAVQIIDEVPSAIPVGTPVLTGLICRPYRHMGFGKQSLLHRLAVVDRRFSGRAYTEVRRQNHLSQRMVESVGMVAVSSNESHIHYVYEANQQAAAAKSKH